MRTQWTLSAYAMAATLSVAAGCGEPATSTSTAPVVQTPKFLWSTIIAGSAIAADSAAVYLSGFSNEVTVLSKQTGLTTRTIPLQNSTSTDGMRMIGNALLLSGNSLSLVDRSSGARRWQYSVTRIDTKLSVDDSTAYVAGASSPNVHAVRLGDGTAKWVGEVVPPTTPPANSLVAVSGGVLDGNVYVATFRVSSPFSINTLQSGMAAFDTRTGQRKWTIALAEDGSRLGHPAIINGIAIATTGSGVSYGVDVNSGLRVWTGTPAGTPLSANQLYGGHAYRASGSAVTTDASIGRSAIDPLSGQRLWRAPDLGVSSLGGDWAMVLPNGQFVATNVGGELIGLEVSRTPRVVWSYPLGIGAQVTSATTLGDTIFFTTRERVFAMVVPR